MSETTVTLAPIQMGARVYFPTLGRFASVDPVDGGTANRYVYVLDPVNGSDYSGMCSGLLGCVGALLQTVKQAVTSGVSKAANTVKKAVSSFLSPSDTGVVTPGANSRPLPGGPDGTAAPSAPARALVAGKAKLNSPGVYQFTQSDGNTYTGMTTRPLGARLQEHINSGKLPAGNEVRYLELPGATRADLRFWEQTWINQAGGIDSDWVGNRINSIREDDWPIYDIEDPL